MRNLVQFKIGDSAVAKIRRRKNNQCHTVEKNNNNNNAKLKYCTRNKAIMITNKWNSAIKCKQQRYETKHREEQHTI